MKVSDLFKRQPVELLKQTNPDQYAPVQRDNTREANEQSDDTVSISPQARQFAKIAQIVAEDEELRQQKVAGLKQQVEAGTYQVPSETVAQAVVSFARDTV